MVAARAVHLEDGEGLLLAHQRADVAHRTDVHLRARQEGRGAAQVDGEAALHAADDGAMTRLVVGEHAFQAGPGLFAAGLLAADDRLAQRVLDALQIDLDAVAHLDGGLAAVGGAEFLQRDAALGLQADVDDGEVLLDRDDQAGHHRAFDEITSAQRFFQQGGEVVAGRVQTHIVSHKLCLLSWVRRRRARLSNAQRGRAMADPANALGVGWSPADGLLRSVAPAGSRGACWICRSSGPGTCLPGARRLDDAAGRIGGFVYTHIGGVEQDGVGRLQQGRRPNGRCRAGRAPGYPPAPPRSTPARPGRTAGASGVRPAPRGRAVTNSLACASGAITVAMSRPSSTAPAAWRANARWKCSRAARTPG